VSAAPSRPPSRINPDGVPPASAFYSHCVVVPPGTTLLYVSGQVGSDAQGVLAPDFAGQIRQAWRNIVTCLTAAAATIDDLVQVRSYLVDGQDVDTFQRVRREFMAKEPPSSTVLFVPRLMVTEFPFEVEVIAAMRTTHST
jgi:2-iminobutanoate/2-iminopropanoate deaminase